MSDRFLEKYQAMVTNNQNYLTVLRKRQGIRNNIISKKISKCKGAWIKIQ